MNFCVYTGDPIGGGGGYTGTFFFPLITLTITSKGDCDSDSVTLWLRLDHFDLPRCSSHIKVTVTLGRKLLGVLLNVFVPTTILNLIGFSTNFYKVKYPKSNQAPIIFWPAGRIFWIGNCNQPDLHAGSGRTLRAGTVIFDLTSLDSKLCTPYFMFNI